MTSAKGRLVTVEGVEGAGKTTAIEAIRERLSSEGVATVFSREPGGTSLGESVRAILLGKEGGAPMTPETELLLMFAARAQHVAEVIEPALARGDWVVCDRFTDATYAYQGAGRGIDSAWIADLEKRVQGDRYPDLTLLLDLPVAAGRERARQRGEPDRFEREQDSFFERVRGRYEERQRMEPQRIRRIDASREPGSVAADVTACIDELRDHG